MFGRLLQDTFQRPRTQGTVYRRPLANGIKYNGQVLGMIKGLMKEVTGYAGRENITNRICATMLY